MPSGLFTLDSELPNLTGKEPPQEQIRKLWDYLVKMKQALQYSLRNLSAENFNTSALQQLTDGAKVEVSEKLNLMQTALNQLNSKVDNISGRVSGVEALHSQVGDLAETDERLAAEIAALQELFINLHTAVYGDNGILRRLQQIEQTISIISVSADGGISIGSEGVSLRLIGQVQINGEIMSGGTT